LAAGAATATYTVVDRCVVSPTVAGNELPIDDNHSPAKPSATAVPADHRDRASKPQDNHRGATPSATEGSSQPDDDHSSGVDEVERYVADDGTRASDEHRSGGSEATRTEATEDRHGATAATTTAPAAVDGQGTSGRGADDRDTGPGTDDHGGEHQRGSP
jgi:hypothetical protein